MKFFVYQSTMTKEETEILNREGWEAGDRLFNVRVQRDVKFQGSKRYFPEMFKAYRPVCMIEARDLDEVFEVGNIGPQRPGASIQKLDRMHSISVGDIVFGDGKFHMVEPCGFCTVEVAA